MPAATTTAVRRASPKATRLVARLTSQQKDLFQRAADLEGRSLTDFAISALNEAAHRSLTNHQVLELSVRDSESFARALLAPAAPSPALRAAAARHRELIGR